MQESLLDVFPRRNSLVLNDSMFVSTWDPTINDWKLFLSIKTTYDAQDRPVESITYFNFDLIGDITVGDQLFYDRGALFP